MYIPGAVGIQDSAGLNACPADNEPVINASDTVVSVLSRTSIIYAKGCVTPVGFETSEVICTCPLTGIVRTGFPKASTTLRSVFVITSPVPIVRDCAASL